MPYISKAYGIIRSLDTQGGDHYVARDFQGLVSDFRPGGARFGG